MTPKPRQFGKAQKLLDASDFDRVFKRAARSSDKYFTVLYRKNGRRSARLGLAVAKKNCRHASARNRIKRIVRESFRHGQTTLGGVDAVVLSRPAAADQNNEVLFASLERHWQRVQRPATSSE